MRLLLTLLIAATALVACDQQRISKLEEGLSTEAEVRQQFGAPAQTTERADGSKLLEYPRQPEGSTNYEITIGADGKLASLRQLLTPANFGKVVNGMEQAEVRRTLGKPATSQTYALKPEETVWAWRFLDGQQKKEFSVTFDRELRVASSATADDLRESMAGGK